jgi:hypothetical protein
MTRAAWRYSVVSETCCTNLGSVAERFSSISLRIRCSSSESGIDPSFFGGPSGAFHCRARRGPANAWAAQRRSGPRAQGRARCAPRPRRGGPEHVVRAVAPRRAPTMPSQSASGSRTHGGAAVEQLGPPVARAKQASTTMPSGSSRAARRRSRPPVHLAAHRPTQLDRRRPHLVERALPRPHLEPGLLPHLARQAVEHRPVGRRSRRRRPSR